MTDLILNDNTFELIEAELKDLSLENGSFLIAKESNIDYFGSIVDKFIDSSSKTIENEFPKLRERETELQKGLEQKEKELSKTVKSKHYFLI